MVFGENREASFVTKDVVDGETVEKEKKVLKENLGKETQRTTEGIRENERRRSNC